MNLKLQVLRQEVKQIGKKSQRVKSRLLALISLTKFISKWNSLSDSDYDRIAVDFDISGRTLRRWKCSYERGGVKALTPSRQPGRKASPIRGFTAKKIRNWRTLYNWGAEVIQAHLEHDHGIKISQSRIQRFLNRNGLFRKRCKLRRIPKTTHTKVVQVQTPGAHTQIDVKHLPHVLPEQKKCYVYNFVDHASRWSFKKVYDSYGPHETRDFMQWVVKTAPFTITRAQSDNGVEFTNKYLSHLDDPKGHALDNFCNSNGIRHVLIPPGEKELQGLVERSHRQDDEELFHRIRPKDLGDFNEILTKHCEWRNHKRRRKALGWKTAMEYLAEYDLKIKNWLYEDQPSPFISVEKNQEEPNSEIVVNDTVKKVA
jgi:transposase